MFYLFVLLFFFVTPCLIVAGQPLIEWTAIKKSKNKEYTLISMFLVSLFTNVPLRKTVNIIILECVYNQKLIKTTLS